MTKTRIAGIDYSLTSPAICVWNSTDDGLFNFDGCDVYYLETPQRWRSTVATTHGVVNLKPKVYPEWKTEQERHDLLSDWALTCLQGCEVFIEGYAFATSGTSHVRSIAENTGLLKHKLYKQKVPIRPVPPTVIKKYATGKGNANKELMYEAFTAELLTPSDLQTRLTPKSKKKRSPVSDIVDAYFIAKWGWEEFL